VIDFNKDHVTPTNTGQAILVLNLAAFGGSELFKGAIDTLIRDIKGSQRLPNVERIWLPGEQSHARRMDYAEHGIPIAAGVVKELASLSSDLGIPALSV
jgi:LDH2 family malate/lactate/ureidoglycolate dehydrogenase